MTLVDRFLSHPEKVHFTFDHGNGHVREYPGTQLLAEAAGLALRLRELGVVPGDRVAVVVPTSEPLLRTIIATWFARAGIVVLPHRLGGTRSASSAERLGRMLAKVEPKVVVGYAEVEAAIRAALGPTQHYLAAEILHETGSAEADSILRPLPEDLALLQFSSGSTREPRAVIVRHGQLLENTASGTDGSRHTPADIVCSWLPVYHDFGMISAVAFPLLAGIRAVLMPTEVFIRDPMSWLRAISSQRGTMSAAPPFALDLLASAIRSGTRVPDLSSWRYVWCAAEPIFPERLTRFLNIVKRHRDLSGVIRPAYGLAEAVVGVAVTHPHEQIRFETIDRTQFLKGDIGKVLSPTDTSVQITACGHPIPNMQVRIATDTGALLPATRRGRIWIKGPSVTEGYWGESESPLRDGWLDTGDEGFMLDGQLYVCGRTKDTLIRGGVNYDAHEIEDAAFELIGQQLPALRCRAVAVFAVRDDEQQRERAVAVLDVKHLPDNRDAAFNAIRVGVLSATGLGLDDVAYARPPGLPRTTSGKLQRSAAREHYLAGDYA